MNPQKDNNFNELGRQAYLDSTKSRQANIDRYKVKTDPILQQNDYYVSKIIYNILIILQSIKEYRLRPESQNYYSKLNAEIAKPERAHKKLVSTKDCLNKEFNDVSPMIENIPHRSQKVTKEYEKRLHQENNKLPKKFIKQSDNIFNFEPLEKEKPKKKMFKGEFPSKHYRDFSNRAMLPNQLGEKTKERKYEGEMVKENIKNFIGEGKKEIPHKKIERPGKTSVQEFFEKNEIRYPPKYKEPTIKPGMIKVEQLLPIAKENMKKIEKNGKNKIDIEYEFMK